MKVIEPSYEIESEIVPFNIYHNLENIARTCYKSEPNGNPENFIKRLIDDGHEAMIEHEHMTVRFIHNRGFTHELVRHRIASYAQESTRYCNYAKEKFGNELTFIKPYWFDRQNTLLQNRQRWLDITEGIEDIYLEMTHLGMSAQAARGILPNDIKTEIVITANLREWRNIFKLRCDRAAHPDMRRVMIPLYTELRNLLPHIFFIKELETLLNETVK